MTLRVGAGAVLAGCLLLVSWNEAVAARRPGSPDTQALLLADEAALKTAGSATQRDALVAHMDSLLTECGKTRGCDIAPLLAIYKRSLASLNTGDPDDQDGGDEEDLIDLPSQGVPQTATADVLLDERNRRFVQMVQMNPAVQAGIRRWLTDMRPSLMTSWENFQYLKSSMLPAFQRRGLSEALLFGIVAKESNGKVHAGSRVGAVGPLQFMPDTGRRFGLGPDGTGFDTRYDPASASMAAAEYLTERYAQLNNSVEMALAAYNGGEGRALRVYQASGGRNFWDSDVYSQFPAETRDYVPMVIAAAWLYLHPRDYGLRFPRISSTPVQLRLQKPTTFNELTICMGNQRGTDGFLRALRNMNPRYEPTQWLPAGTTLTVTGTMSRAYSWHCQSGKRAELAHELVMADPSQAIVRVGTFSPAETSATTIDNASPAQVPAQIAQMDARPRPQPVPAKAEPAKPAQKPTPKPAKPATHRVRPGENLTGIADDNQCDLRALTKANDLKAPRYAIRPGQVLTLDGCGK